MTLAASKVERGERVKTLQEAIFGEGDTNVAAIEALQSVADRYGIPAKWVPTRLSKIRHGTQDVSVTDLACFVYLARENGIEGEYTDWFFLGFGITEPAVQDIGPRYRRRKTDPRSPKPTTVESTPPTSQVAASGGKRRGR